LVKVTSSSGKNVNVEILGIAETMRNIQFKQKKLIDSTQIEIVQAANLLNQELQESIVGNRAEAKSVETGKFGNSIETEMINTTEYVIQPKNIRYSNSTMTTRDIAKFMEYGTSKGIAPRHHFRNTRLRMRPKITAKFLRQVNISLK